MADLIQTVRDMLREGFGVEDIALQLGQPVEGVRLMVRRWQETGAIKAILGKNLAGLERQLRTGLTETPPAKEMGHGLSK